MYIYCSCSALKKGDFSVFYVARCLRDLALLLTIENRSILGRIRPQDCGDTRMHLVEGYFITCRFSHRLPLAALMSLSILAAGSTAALLQGYRD